VRHVPAAAFTAFVRQRFTIGHELGHLTLHHGHDLILERLVRLNFRDATSSTANDEEEIEANHFAAELLMPHDFLRAQPQHSLAGTAAI
jgi:Zn-dependent peptidase ImmA (M78 family)